MKHLFGMVKWALILLAVVVSSCSDAGLLLPIERGESNLVIQNVSKGSVLRPDDTFEIDLDFDDEEVSPDRLVIELLDSDGTVLFSVDLGQEDIYDLPLPVLLPDDLAEGIYSVSVTVYQDGEEAESDQSLFFFVREEYQINAIVAYPQIFYPGGAGLVLADLDIPEAADPFLRWTSGDTVFLEGTLSEGADELQLDVGDREGVITIRLEVFPFGPDAFGAVADPSAESAPALTVFDFVSFISLEAQFFVSTSQDIDEEEFGPEEHYFSLFHFRGETIDWGFNGNGAPAVPVGSPKLAIEAGAFGYLLDGSNGFIIDDILLPFEDGVLQPFSFSGRFAPLSTGGSVLKIVGKQDTPVFSVSYDEGGFYTAALGESTSSSISDGGTEGVVELTLSVIPGEETIRFLWYFDGVLVADELVAHDSDIKADEGTTLIGGLDGLHGVVDEIGIYYRVTEAGSDVDADVFARAMDREYGSDLVVAEGFDGIFLPERIIYDVAAEEYTIDGGSLFLSPGSGIGFITMPAEFESLAVSVEWDTAEEDGQSEGDLVLGGLDGDEIVIDLGVRDDETVGPPMTEVRLESVDGTISVFHDDAVVATTDLIGDTLYIRNRSVARDLELRSVLVVKNLVQIEE
jgi:hypothetical protein